MMRVLRKLFTIGAVLCASVQPVQAGQPKDPAVKMDVVLAALNKGDTAGAINYLLPLAKSGHVEAQFMLVSVLQGTDQKQAVQWLVTAAQNKHPAACHVLGTMYLEGNGMPKDRIKAEEFLRCGADGGEPGAQVALGMLYRVASPATGRREDEQAAVLFRKAADKGSAEAQYRLAEMYRYGYGVEQNKAEAIKLLRLATAQGHMEANRMLAEMGQ
jgi:TPR repeat protein